MWISLKKTISISKTMMAGKFAMTHLMKRRTVIYLNNLLLLA